MTTLTFPQIWVITYEPIRATVNRSLTRYNMVLPNPPKSPSQIPMFNVAPNAPVTNFNETLNQFKEELSRSLENSLGVQIKPNRSTYHKP
jgi:hypothetical protein